MDDHQKKMMNHYMKLLLLIIVTLVPFSTIFAIDPRAITFHLTFPEDEKSYFFPVNHLQKRTDDGLESISIEELTSDQIKQYLQNGYKKDFILKGHIIVLYRSSSSIVWADAYAWTNSWENPLVFKDKYISRLKFDGTVCPFVGPQPDEQILLIWCGKNSGEKRMFIPDKKDIIISLPKKPQGGTIFSEPEFPRWTITWPDYAELKPLPPDVQNFVDRELALQEEEIRKYKPISIKK